MKRDDVSNDLRHLISENTAPYGRDFDLRQRDGESFILDAIFRGERLPCMDFERLGAAISAKPLITSGQCERKFDDGSHVRGTYPVAAKLEGFHKGQPITVFLRCDFAEQSLAI